MDKGVLVWIDHKGDDPGLFLPERYPRSYVLGRIYEHPKNNAWKKYYVQMHPYKNYGGTYEEDRGLNELMFGRYVNEQDMRIIYTTQVTKCKKKKG